MPTRNKKTSAKSKKSAAMVEESGEDIIQLILEDHKPLKKLIKVMKDSDKTHAERKKAMKEFGPLLTRHAKPEEQVLYVFMKDEEEFRMEGFEGDVEHGLAEQMIDEIKRAEDKDVWSAKVKVLAELVEHHIEEEESDLLPDFRKHSEKQERIAMGRMYLEAKENTMRDGSQKDPTFTLRDMHLAN